MEALGINPLQLAAQIVNFLIIFFILYKLTYRTILKVLGEREKKICESMEYSDKIKAEWEKMGKVHTEEVGKARKEAEMIREEAKLAADENRQAILTEAREEAEGLVKKEMAAFEEKKRAEEKTLRTKTIEMSTLIAERLIRDYLRKEDQQSMVDEAIKQLDSMKS